MNLQNKNLKKIEHLFDEAPLWGKLISIGIPLLLILGALYFNFNGKSIQESDLSRLQLMLSRPPQIMEESGKNTSQWMQLSTYKYKDRLVLSDEFTYRATNIKKIMDSIVADNLVTIKIKTTDLSELQGSSNTKIEIYGLEKNGQSYTDLALRNQLQKDKNKWLFILIPIVTILLFYILFKKEPKMAMKKVFGILAIIIVAIVIGFYLINI